MKNRLIRDPGLEKFFSDNEEKRLLAEYGGKASEARLASGPVQGHTLHESLMGYEFGEELFDDGSLDPDTHSRFVSMDELPAVPIHEAERHFQRHVNVPRRSRRR